MPELRRNEILPDFFKSLVKFGFDDFFTSESSGEPHQLQIVTDARENYLHRFFSASNDILKNAYAESDAHTYVSMLDIAVDLAAAERGYTRPEKKKEHEWSALFPEVEEAISAHGPETKAAFETLFGFCKKYSKSVDELDAVPGHGRTITFEKNGLSDAEASQLRAALELIWKAYPDTDPRVIEGHDYTLSSAPVMKEFFPRYTHLGNDRRSDFNIAALIENPGSVREWDRIAPGKCGAIAAQTAENIAALKPFAQSIAERDLAWYLKRVYKFDERWDSFAQSRSLARNIFNEIAGGASIPSVAKKIEHGGYGQLLGQRNWGVKDDDRKNAIAAAKGAAQFLTFAVDVSNGTWFDSESARMRDLAAKAPAAPQQAPG